MSDLQQIQHKSPIRILALDGGGVRGALTALILQDMEDYLNAKDEKDIPLGQRFDLIVGTSVGAIIGLSLASGKSAKESAEYCIGGKEEDKPTGKIQRIFGRKKCCLRWLFCTAKHDSNELKKALDGWFGNTRLNELGPESIAHGPHVLVTSTALAKPSLRTWKSPLKPEYAARANQKLADVAYASAAAPTIFHAQTKETFDAPNADGGLCANNPAMVAIIEVLRMGKELDQIRLVSVGTGIPCGMPYDPNKIGIGGGHRWLFNRQPMAIPLIELMMQAQSDLAQSQAKFMLEKKGLYLRIDRRLDFSMTLDELNKVNLLKAYSNLNNEEHEMLIKIFSIPTS